MAAQFFSSLADNALLVAAIALLMQADAPSWLTPYLKFFFVISYVLLAPYVGAFADRLAKGQVMFIANSIKIVGCITMLVGADPLLAYAIVGLGAAAYSPAKYGILTEYLPHRKLVLANGWIEGLTVASILLGTVLGGAAHPRARVGRAAGLRPALHRHADRHARRGRHHDHRGGVRRRRAVQPRGAAHRRGAQAPARASVGDAEGLRALRGASCGRTGSARSRSP